MGLEYLNDIEPDPKERSVPKADKGTMKLSIWDKKREVYKHVDADVSETKNIRPLLPIIAKNNGVEQEELFYYEVLVPPLTEGLNNWSKWRNMKVNAEDFDKLQVLRAKARRDARKGKDDDEEDDEEDTKFTGKRKK